MWGREESYRKIIGGPMMRTSIDAPDAAPATRQNGQRTLTPAARRALAEAQARRARLDAKAAALARRQEFGGRGGLEPVRYDDWEVKGLASDF
jgi:hypothetical protein